MTDAGGPSPTPSQPPPPPPQPPAPTTNSQQTTSPPPPQWELILLFSQMFLLKSNHVRGWHPHPTINKIGTPTRLASSHMENPGSATAVQLDAKATNNGSIVCPNGQLVNGSIVFPNGQLVMDLLCSLMGTSNGSTMFPNGQLVMDLLHCGI